MEYTGIIILIGYFIWSVLKDIRDTLIAMRIQNDRTFIDMGWIKYRRLQDGSIETIEVTGYKKYKSAKHFQKKNGRSIC